MNTTETRAMLTNPMSDEGFYGNEGSDTQWVVINQLVKFHGVKLSTNDTEENGREVNFISGDPANVEAFRAAVEAMEENPLDVEFI